jgi:hypothetical protein
MQIESIKGATVAGPSEQKGKSYSWLLQTSIDTVAWTSGGTITATGATQKPFGPVTVNRSARYIRIFSNNNGFVDWSEITVIFPATASQQSVSSLPQATTPQQTPQSAVNVPKSIDLSHYRIAKAVVKFEHANHVARQITCITCHHKPKDGKAQVKCSICHQNESAGNCPSYKDAFHTRCKTCHTATNDTLAPTKCNQCHKS